MRSQHTFSTLSSEALATVAGGRTDPNQQIQLMLTQLSSSIKEVAQKKNETDPTMMMMMVMMMSGMKGGGGGQAAAAPPPPEAAPAAAAPTVVNVNVRGRHRWF